MMVHAPNLWTDISALIQRPRLLAWNLTMAREYNLLDRIIWGTDYVGDRVDEWADQIRIETRWLREELNPILKGCGWPEFRESELEAILCENAKRLFGV